MMREVDREGDREPRRERHARPDEAECARRQHDREHSCEHSQDTVSGRRRWVAGCSPCRRPLT
ncbi:hypothetical protein [Mumia zhuanghuii]|uniref:Uncharacterized protein n=1 Tax=Mumia zhuanghuii TaxID=2585211 RepID=A0A5C4M1S9_9ACTN|nr:hypothetical protein [Mumia zhuanghuii]TNC26012.1 hypothetical protein FHE65_34755 [Mumia zhuanghuii]